MLPIPLRDNIPALLRAKLDESQSGTDLIDQLEEYVLEWSEETFNLVYLKTPERCPASFLDELGNYVNAGITNLDEERTKRQKIRSAVKGHKLRGTWEADVKPKVDAIAGGDSQIFTPSNQADWIMLGAETSDPDVYWATMGMDGVDDDLGIDLVGSFEELVIAGNIAIDVDNASLTSDELDNIVATLELDILPAYYRINIGYVDGGGNFVSYVIIG